MKTSELKKEKRFKKRWVAFGLTAVLCLYLLAVQTIPRFPMGPYKLYGDLTEGQRTQVISSTNITNEKTYPFKGGRDGENYSSSILKFPDTKSCLIKTERLRNEPDLRFINWDSFRSLKEVEVCIWRIFSNLDSPQDAKEWLIFHDANGVDLRNIDPVTGQKSFRVNFIVGARLQSNWSDSFKRMPYPSRGFRVFQEGGFRSGNGVTAYWDESGKLKFLYMKWTVLL